jgi:hypothetical protein
MRGLLGRWLTDAVLLSEARAEDDDAEEEEHEAPELALGADTVGCTHSTT